MLHGSLTHKTHTARPEPAGWENSETAPGGRECCSTALKDAAMKGEEKKKSAGSKGPPRLFCNNGVKDKKKIKGACGDRRGCSQTRRGRMRRVAVCSTTHHCRGCPSTCCSLGSLAWVHRRVLRNRAHPSCLAVPSTLAEAPGHRQGVSVHSAQILPASGSRSLLACQPW